MRRPLIAGNWKMHKGVAETTAFLEDLLAEPLPPAVDVLCCPPFVALPAAAMMLATALPLGPTISRWPDTACASGARTAALRTTPRT